MTVVLLWDIDGTLLTTARAGVRALELAARITRNGPLAVRATKQVVRQAPGWPAGEVWDRQQRLLEEVFGSADAREGARAFAERREPRWQGR